MPSVAQRGVQPTNESRGRGVILIHVRKDGGLVVEGKGISVDDLDKHLKGVATKFPNQAVIIRGYLDTRYGTIVRVLDVCRKAGIWNVAFATCRPSDSSGSE